MHQNTEKWKKRLFILLQHLSPRLAPFTQHDSSFISTAQSAINRTIARPGANQDVLLQFSPMIRGKIKRSLVTYLSPHEAFTVETLQAGVLLVAHTRPNVRRNFIDRLCAAAVERNALVYAIAPSGGVSVSTPGVYRLTTHPTLSRRDILGALLRHGAHLLVFGLVSTRDDVMALMEAAYTGYHCVAEIYGESAHDVLSRLEAIGVDTTMLPQNLRVVVPAMNDDE